MLITMSNYFSLSSGSALTIKNNLRRKKRGEKDEEGKGGGGRE